jgi:tRNA pseudouridine38-40 synthase
MHYRLVVEYDGTDFHGWQVQPEARTVQGVLEASIERLFGHPVRVRAGGRTDAGVHAAGQVVCFHSPRVVVVATIARALNALTPADIAVRSADVVPDEFDPRRMARRRSYLYRIWNRRAASPFWRRFAWHVPQALDVDAMLQAAAQIEGEHDFSSFQGTGCDAAHPIRRVFRSAVLRDGDLITYEIDATAFLRHMVRNIVGTLVEIGRGARANDVEALLLARDRTKAGATAPPHGLCLTVITY